jgi:hypothetical protein
MLPRLKDEERSDISGTRITNVSSSPKFKNVPESIIDHNWM